MAAVGCGNGGVTEASPVGKRTAGPAKAWGEKELERIALAPGDLDGFSVSPMVGEVGAGQPKVNPIAPDPAQCKPLNDMIGYVGRYQPVWQVAKTVGETPGGHRDTVVALNSYRQQESVKVMTELRSALGICTKFALPYTTLGWTYSDIQKLPDPSLGDDSLSYRITLNMPADDIGPAQSVVFSYLVVRNGTTVTTFTSNPVGVTNKPTEVPRQVVDAQLEKVTEALAG
ncbi:hypothetical protein ACFYXS_04585 [Streptomyces sp. NPDC002574]|uniref:hypothetical protein n=1 Tax=Streptomyces sp. NPDC002574 TaxID=3364652 RepID=UPI003691D60A